MVFQLQDVASRSIDRHLQPSLQWSCVPALQILQYEHIWRPIPASRSRGGSIDRSTRSATPELGRRSRMGRRFRLPSPAAVRRSQNG